MWIERKYFRKKEHFWEKLRIANICQGHLHLIFAQDAQHFNILSKYNFGYLMGVFLIRWETSWKHLWPTKVWQRQRSHEIFRSAKIEEECICKKEVQTPYQTGFFETYIKKSDERKNFRQLTKKYWTNKNTKTDSNGRFLSWPPSFKW